LYSIQQQYYRNIEYLIKSFCLSLKSQINALQKIDCSHVLVSYIELLPAFAKNLKQLVCNSLFTIGRVGAKRTILTKLQYVNKAGKLLSSTVIQHA